MAYKMAYISIVIIAFLVGHVNSDVTCNAGTFSEGTKGFVRCEFGTDVKQGNLSFTVVYCGSDICDSTKTYALACDFLDGKQQCRDLKPGYVFDGQVDSSLTLVIASLTEQTTGVYKCVIPDDDSLEHTCNLTLTATNATNQPIRDDPEPKEQVNEGFPASSVVLLVVLLVVLVLVLVVVVLSVIFIRHKNISREKDVEQPEPNETGIASNRFVKACEGFAIRKKLLAPPAPPKSKSDAFTFTELGVFDRGVQAVVKTDENSAQCDLQPVYTSTPSHSNTRGIYRAKGEHAHVHSPVPPRQHSVTEGPAVSGEPHPSTSGNTASNGERKSRSHSATNENKERNDQDDHDGNENDDGNKESTRLLAGCNPRTPDRGSTSAQDAYTYNPLMNDFRTWDNNDVCLWLKHVGLERLVDYFKAKNFTGPNLVRPRIFGLGDDKPISQADLKKMGITQKADQDAVQTAIEDLIKSVK